VARALRRAAAVLAALTAIRLVFAAILPLTPDEAYYWVWSRALAPGYLDHPPMVALWIRAGTLLLADTPLGVRLFGPLAAAFGSVMLADAAERMFPGRRAGVTAGALWNATLLVGAGSITMTPDTPLLFFWCATLWAMTRLTTGGGAGWWLAAGVFGGAALVSKYTAAFLWIGIGLWALAIPAGRRWLRSPAPWVGALLGIALFLPVLRWNADHAWISFLKQGGRVGNWRPERAVGFLAELIGGQIGLATPGVWILCMAGLMAGVRTVILGLGPISVMPAAGASGSPRTKPKDDGGKIALLLALSLPPALVFIQHAFGDRVQGNWPAIIYPAAVMAAAGLIAPRWPRSVAPSAGLGFVLTVVILLHVATGLLPLPIGSDPSARQLAGWTNLALNAESIRQREHGAYVVAEEYALISELAWNAPATMPVVGIEARLNPMTLPRSDMAGRTGILVRAEHRGEAIDPNTWSSAVPLGFIDRTAARGTVERYGVWRVIGRIVGEAMPGRGLAE
jgi:4-amino-4-deoxy-L-arabinose transferase-like glycosyltransferase